jgi:hypothetical protein
MKPLRSVASAVVLLLAGVLLCSGQKVQLVPDIAVAEAEYRDANEAWLQNDPNLAGDLFKTDPEDARRRIHKAAALSDDLMAKKQTYLQLIIERFQETRKRLTQAKEGTIPTATLKKELEAQQARVLDDQERVEGQLREFSQSDEYLLVKHALSEERASLIALQNDIALRIRSLDTLGKTQEAVQGASQNDALAQKLDGVLQTWEQQRAGAARQRVRWAEVYHAMEKSLDQKAPTGKGAPAQGGANSSKQRKGKKPNPDAPAAPPSAPAKESAPPGRSAGLAGTWIYRSQPGAWTGYGEPEEVTLELRRVDGEWIGAYTARLPVRSAVHDVRLTLSGAGQSNEFARLHWRSKTPEAEGEMAIRLSGDGRILVERAASDDSYIPRGMEVLLTP